MRPTRGARRGQRRGGFSRTTRPRLPKSLTAGAPFIIGRNRQMLSVPDHREGLSVHRKIRLTRNPTAGSETIITYRQVLSQFLAELGFAQAGEANSTFSIDKVEVFAVAASGVTPLQLGIVVNDEPRAAATAGNFDNNPYFRAIDSSVAQGIAHCACGIPTSARYTIGSHDTANLLALGLVAATTSDACILTFDLTGTFTSSPNAGFSLRNDFRALTLSSASNNQPTSQAEVSPSAPHLPPACEAGACSGSQ